jgi:hypothetical protein
LGYLLEVLVLLVVAALEESYQMVQAHLHFVYLDTLELFYPCLCHPFQATH